MVQDLGGILENLCKEGLPRLSQLPQGLDGIEIEIRIDGFEEPFSFWIGLPKEWMVLKPILVFCIDSADLDEHYRYWMHPDTSQKK